MKKLFFIALAILNAAPIFLATGWISAFAGMTEGRAAGEIAVIVNEAGPIANISDDDIKEIYLGNMRFSGGIRLLPINYREGPVRDAFISEVVGMSPKEYRFYWIKKVFQDGVLVPTFRNSSAFIISSVRDARGAIGYLPLTELGGSKGIKVLMIIKYEGNDK